MKKKMLAILMTLALCCAPASVFAESGATVDSVMELSQAFQETVSSTSMKITLNLGMDLLLSSEGAEPTSLPISMTGDFDVKSIVDPVQMSMDGTYNMSFLGQAMDMDLEMYTVQSEDGQTMDTFSKLTGLPGSTAESQWTHNQADMTSLLKMFGAGSLEELQKMDSSDTASSMNLDWTLDESGDAYVLSGTVDFAEMLDAISEDELNVNGTQAPQQSLDMIKLLLDGMTADISIDIDKETGAQTALHLDMSDSDLSGITDLISSFLVIGNDSSGASMPDISVELNELSGDCVYTYNDVSEITIPADALGTDATNITDIVSSLSGNLNAN